ncbi:MAG: DUF2950 family protein [Planctomycetota bacterium]|nr:DUF2950 family protein [Planctomycetota bacterium]
MKLSAWIMVASLTLAVSGWTLEDADVRKKLAELKAEDAKARAAAVTELTPLFVDMLVGLGGMRADKSPEVIAALQGIDQQFQAKLLQNPAMAKPRMAANESAAAASCKAYAEAQEIYHRTDYDGDGVLEYSQALKGDNSLLEQKAGANDLALIDKSFANAEGNPGKATPKAGYCFKILTKQGAAATGGARDYIANGHMTLGYALIAYPAEYGKTGKKCFMVNNNGTIFEADLGAETHAIVEKMTEFNPDNKIWTPSE